MSLTESDAKTMIENARRGRATRSGGHFVGQAGGVFGVDPLQNDIDHILKPRMNKTELAYSRLLDLRIKAGEIVKYKFGKITLVLADPRPGIRGLKYTPDFEIVLPDGRIEFHETKGKHIYEDSWIKFKMAIQLFPEFKFVLCQYIKGSWSFKNL